MSSPASPESRPPARRFRFQLAPLVDLLLIVVFAQFLEIRETVSQEESAVRAQLEESEQQVVRAQNQLDQTRQALNVAQAETIRLESLQRQQAQQTARALSSISSAFQRKAISDDELEAIVGDQAGDLSPVVQQLTEKVASSSPEEMVRFFIGHAELLKRAEIWHLHADENRRVQLHAAGETTTIQLERRGQDDRTMEMEDQLFAAYKQLPQPKGLVVILVSYSPRSVAGVYQPLVDGMPKAVERMRTDLPATRFEYTVLGTTALPDILREQTSIDPGTLDVKAADSTEISVPDPAPIPEPLGPLVP